MDESRTAGGFEDSGGDEDSGRSGGQWEELMTSGDTKKGSIHYLKGLSLSTIYRCTNTDTIMN